MKRIKVAVIGAGAAGMMAAITAAELGAETVIIEKSRRCGLKLGITGKGRCNLTNDSDLGGLLANTVNNPRFLYSAYSGFMPRDVMDFFENAGVPLKVERGNRVFPSSDRSLDIVEALVRLLKEKGVKIIKAKALSVMTEDGRATGVMTDGGAYSADRVIIATGGLSYPLTGSTGDGYEMAKELGHSVTPLLPALVSLICRGGDPQRLEGLSLKNVSVSVVCRGKEVFSDFGEMLFTKNGVSGPVILSASSVIASKKTMPCTLHIDLKPALSESELDARILRDFSDIKNRDFSNSLGKLLPSKLIPVVIGRCGVAPETKVNSVTKAEREKLVKVLKDFSFDIISAGKYDEAVITSGGISVKEIDPRTMGSKIIKGLFFAGEIIDVDAFTGGFNLQIAWSTGKKAGQGALEEEV